MVASTDIKFYVHTNNNAPQLQNAYGSMINVLDACLINGVNIGTVSSLTASGTTVTVLFSSAHNLMQYQVIKITGANQSEFNGEHRILTVPNAQSVTFELAAAPSITIATGTITASLPPLGWEKPFSSSNPIGGGKAAYRSKNLLLPSRPFLRVVDELDPAYTATYAKYAKVGIVEDMTDIDTMPGVQAPYDSLNANKNWVGTGSGEAAYNGWARWYYATALSVTSSQSDTQVSAAGNRNYVIIGTGETFFILNNHVSGLNYSLCYGFGAFNPIIDTDNRPTFLAATTHYYAAKDTLFKSQYSPLMSTETETCLLSGGLNNPNSYALASAQTFTNTLPFRSGYINYLNTPATAKKIHMSNVFLQESSGILRGEIPLLRFIHHDTPFSRNEIFTDSNKAYIAINVDSVNGAGTGQIAFFVGNVS